jgi:hypothetical protein
MKLISCAILVLLYTSLSKQEEEDPYPACHGDFEPTEELCNRFDFKSSQEVKQNKNKNVASY